MFTKLQAIYPNSIVTKQKPDDYFDQYHWFSDETENWIGIPKEEIKESQLQLLSTLFHYYQPGYSLFHSSPLSQSWYSYLYENGPIPVIQNHNEHSVRFIYFQWTSSNISYSDFESAIQAFFDIPIAIIWENSLKGIILEQKSKHPLTENDFIAMNETLKTDFFIEPFFYIGKFRELNGDFLSLVQDEKSLLDFALHNSKTEKVFYFEWIVPRLITNQIPQSLKNIILDNIFPVFKEDRELFLSIKAFLDNNLNSSYTAKKLFIHRNTLQYRVDKFTEKTGIALKEFPSILTVYLACILFENTQ
jgi:DNA-binding PucR family transcriptional regulator